MFSQWRPGSNTTRMDIFPKCRMCNEGFTLKGPVPYLLPCLHAVCETCMTSAAGGVISCSTCQKEVNLAETHLQKDVVRQRQIFHLTIQHHPSELLCTHEDDGNQAVCWCQQCEDFLCEHCQTMHESFKLTRTHTIQDIGDIQPGTLANEQYCSTHKKYPLDHWDRSCNILICAKCKLRDHADHEVEDVDEAADTTRTEMEAQNIEVKSIAGNHKSLFEMMREHISCIDESSSFLMDNIGHTFSSLRSLVDQREKELLSARQQDIDQMKTNLTRMTTLSKSSYLKCKMTADYIQKALHFSSKYDLLGLRLTISDTIQICSSSAPAEGTGDHPLPIFSTEGLDKLKIAVAVFGDAVPKKPDINRNITSQEIGIQTNINENEKDADTLRQEIICLNSRVQELATLVLASEREQSKLKKQVEQKSKDNAELQRKTQESDKTYKRLHASLFNIGLSPEANYHLLKTSEGDKSLILQCIQLKMDADRVNTDVACIDQTGHLVNTPEYKCHHKFNRLTKHQGTSSTQPLLCCGFPQYWEVKVRVDVNAPLKENSLVLEIGLCIKEDQDHHHCIDGQFQSYALNVSHCETHNSLCREVRKDGIYVLCLPYTLPNSPGQSATLHYGVVFDDSRKKVAFLDITENKVISTLENVDCREPLWPMFGVYNRYYASVSMSLVVDHDIVMWDGKKEMIRKSLL